MSRHLKKYICLVFLVLLIVGCTNVEPTVTPTQRAAPTAAPIPAPTETAVPDDQAQVSAPLAALAVPIGEPPVIDGVLSPDEWANAAHTVMSDGSDLYWLFANDLLYLAVKSPDLGAVNLTILNGDQVRILHSSAALGSAIYQKEADRWQLTQDFSWCCRSTTNFGEMEQLFENEGWLASIGFLGIHGEVEFQVALPAGEIRVAVTNMFADSSISFWPVEMSQPAVDQLAGYRNDFEDFHLDQWIPLRIGD